MSKTVRIYKGHTIERNNHGYYFVHTINGCLQADTIDGIKSLIKELEINCNKCYFNGTPLSAGNCASCSKDTYSNFKPLY